ncbi:lytic transglycosylase [Burkholderia pseudomallei]|uniref:lytic transglycosylase domain-containing protein n=1 Tax=Burkholderia pseudomallei TaxID=28450 RepID=UPI00097581F3|nr:lytic transglycosylase domain-containing protein [Burkholderia pseudomallei]ONC29708.1 lytic transglycosylase [Burkholderia pseudomallei]
MRFSAPTIRQIGLLIAVAILSCRVAHASCWEDAGSQYGIDPALLKAIAWKESRGWTGARGPMLKDGNQAIGLMQINTVHLPTLARVGIQRRDLFDACTSQRVGAWVLANCISQFGSTWKAVGCYNTGPASTNTAAQLRYVRDVQRYYAAYKRAQLEAQ